MYYIHYFVGLSPPPGVKPVFKITSRSLWCPPLLHAEMVSSVAPGSPFKLDAEPCDPACVIFDNFLAFLEEHLVPSLPKSWNPPSL